jgi:hypothetical protein
MEKEFVPYELALRMKALDYDEPCFAYFLNSILQYPAWEKDYSYFNEMSDINPNFKKHEHVLAPTWQSAFRWFREKYKLYCYPNPTGSWRYTGIYRGEDKKGKHWVGSLRDISGIILFFDSFEEAEIACLIKLIEIVEKELIN